MNKAGRFCRLTHPSIFILHLLFALLVGARLWAGSIPAAIDSIHGDQMRKHCEVLASDTLEGRETGTRGGEAAGAYIVNALRRYKARPAGPDGDYYQPFPPNSRNILVVLPGRDAALRGEYVLVGAHYDHVGYGSPRNSRGPIGYIHNGADDNASGVSALLELVEAFESLDAAPKRSILFIFWDAEEAGLLGSQYFAASPTVSLERIRMVFNIDMIGRLRQDRAEVYGSRSAPGLRQFLSAQNLEAPVSLSFTWETRRDSDHYTFFSHQIPYLMIFTGKHADYHTPYDDVEKLNIQGMERITRLLFRAVHAAADEPAIPPFRSTSVQEGAQAQLQAETPLAALPARLGVGWDAARALDKGIVITSVDSGSAAELAGLKAGDRITEFDGLPIAGPDDLREAVLTAPSRTTAVILGEGGARPTTRQIRLPGAPEWIGVFCRTDDAEPGSLIVQRVAPGSPTSRAGLKANDRIEKVAGGSFTSGDELLSALKRQVGSFEIQSERDGHERIVRISLRARRSPNPEVRQKSPPLPGLVSPLGPGD